MPDPVAIDCLASNAKPFDSALAFLHGALLAQMRLCLHTCSALFVDNGGRSLLQVIQNLIVYPCDMTFPIMENSGVPPPPQGMLKVKLLKGIHLTGGTDIFSKVSLPFTAQVSGLELASITTTWLASHHGEWLLCRSQPWSRVVVRATLIKMGIGSRFTVSWRPLVQSTPHQP